MPIKLVNKETGARELVSDTDVSAALASGRYLDPAAVPVHRFGEDTYAAPDVARNEADFTTPADPGQVSLLRGHAIRAEENSGIGAGARSLLGGAVSGATAGLIDPYQDEQEFHPIASGVGNVAGVLGPALLGDEAGLAGLLPSAAISRGGTAVAERLGGGVLARGVAGAAEGAAFGAGQATGDLLRTDDPLTWERAASSLSSNMLYGGMLGGGLGLAGGVFERGLAKARGTIDDALERASAQRVVQTQGPGAIADAELETLDKAGLKAARDAEIKRIGEAQQPEREAFVKSIREARDAAQEERPWDYAIDHENRHIRGLSAESYQADRRIRDLLKNEEGLAAKPERALDALQRQDQALELMMNAAEDETARFKKSFDTAPDQIRRDILDNKVPGYVVGKGGLRPDSPLIDQAVEREMLTRYGSLDEPVLPKRLANIDNIRIARVRNQELRDRLAALTKDPTSERLTKIDQAADVLGAPHQRSLGERIVHAIPVVGRVADIANASTQAVSGMRLVANKAARKTAEATSAFLGRTEQVVARAPVVATKVLSSVRFAAPSDDHKEEPKDLAGLFKARTDEIKSQTAYDATGVPRMRPEARAAMAERLKGLRVVDPITADRIETLAARRLEYLSSLIPRRPDFGIPQLGGADRYQPSDMEMRSFARSVAAAEDPGAVEWRVVHGSLTPEDVAAYWAVHPERAQHFKQEVLNGLPGMTKHLPYAKRITLGMFIGQPLDPAMHPRVLAALQSQFPDEPGTAGGTQAPKPVPQFGSIKKSISAPTPAQTRAQGAFV